MDGTVARRRVVEWQDPMASAKLGRGLAGREFMQRIIDGAIPPPPIAVLMGFTVTEVGDGFAVFEMRPGEYHYNPIGAVHGGVVSTMLDSAMGCAVHTTVPLGRAYTTLELKVNIVRAVTTAVRLIRAEGRVIHGGRQVATAEGKLVDETGRLYAHGTTTCLVFDIPQKGG
jgi:uncharacterized protein (TIGR00369 family)